MVDFVGGLPVEEGEEDEESDSYEQMHGTSSPSKHEGWSFLQCLISCGRRIRRRGRGQIVGRVGKGGVEGDDCCRRVRCERALF